MLMLPAILGILFTVNLFSAAYGQEVINVTSTEPCFLNYSAGIDMWSNCGADQDFLQFSLVGWEWITGGYFSMVLVSVIMLSSYIKYHKAIYPLAVGILFLPISYFAFPNAFVDFGAVLAGVLIGILIYITFVKRTKEY